MNRRGSVLLCAAVASCCLAKASADSIVSDWGEKVRRTIEDHPGDVPVITPASHPAALAFTAAYEAWAAYEPVAESELFGQSMDGVGGASTEANKAEAVSHAIHATMLVFVPSAQADLADYMAALGYDPAAQTPPALLGRAASAAVVASRLNDGSNWENVYRDTSGYVPPPPGNPAAWQPIDDDGLLQKPLTPHWGQVRSFSLSDNDMFRPVPPAPFDSPGWHAQVQEILDYTANLTDVQKTIVEYWCPVGDEGTYTLFRGMHMSDEYSQWRGLDLDRDVLLFFLAANAVLDAGISCWEGKYHYDYARPYTAIRALGDVPIMGWGGPGQGTVPMLARDFQPYHLITPPFPEYTSGHATFAAAWAMAVRRMFASEEWDFHPVVDRLLYDERELDPPVVLHYATLYETAEDSGLSRLYGAVHWRDGYEQGRWNGRRIGSRVFQKAQALFLGTWTAAENNMLGLWGVGGYSDLAGLLATTTRADGQSELGIVVDDSKTANRVYLGTEEALLLEVDANGAVGGFVDVLAVDASGNELLRASVPVSGRTRCSANGEFPGTVRFANAIALRGSLVVDGTKIDVAVAAREKFSTVVAAKRDLIDMAVAPGFRGVAAVRMGGIAAGRADIRLLDALPQLACFDSADMAFPPAKAVGGGTAVARTAFGIVDGGDGSMTAKATPARGEKPGRYAARAAAGPWRAKVRGTHDLADVSDADELETAARATSLAFTGPATKLRLKMAR